MKSRLQSNKLTLKKNYMTRQMLLHNRQRFYSTQLTEPNPPKAPIDHNILPWSHQTEPTHRLLSQKEMRSNIINPNKESKRSVDERIDDIYRKYSRDKMRLEECLEVKSENCRQAYRKKLDELQKVQQFKQLGSVRHQGSFISNFPDDHDLQLLRLKNFSNYYYLDEQILNSSQEKQPVTTPEYKCTRNFQRMLKIKDKIRKKNFQAVSKDKQKYHEQQSTFAKTHRDPSNTQISAKATLERNKLKIKMRGLSNKKIPGFQQSPACMEVVGTCSNALQYAAQRQHFNLTYYTGWNGLKTGRGGGGMARFTRTGY